MSLAATMDYQILQARLLLKLGGKEARSIHRLLETS